MLRESTQAGGTPWALGVEARTRAFRRATAGIARVYRMLHGRLKSLPGAQQDVLFRSYLGSGLRSSTP